MMNQKGVSTILSDKEKRMIIQEFQDKAFPDVPVKGIIGLLNENKKAWYEIIFGVGDQYIEYGNYSKEIMEACNGNLNNVQFVLLALDKSSLRLFELLREKADYFESGSAFSDVLRLGLFFIKK